MYDFSVMELCDGSMHLNVALDDLLFQPTELEGDIGMALSVSLFLCSSVLRSSVRHTFGVSTNLQTNYLNLVAELIMTLPGLNWCSRHNEFQPFPSL